MIENLDLATPYFELKELIVQNVGLAKDALHIYVAVIIYLGSCLILRWSAASVKPWLLVMFAAVLGEVLDWQWNVSREYTINWNYHFTDLWNTMLVPTMLLLASRFTPIFSRKSPPEKIVSLGDSA